MCLAPSGRAGRNGLALNKRTTPPGSYLHRVSKEERPFIRCCAANATIFSRCEVKNAPAVREDEKFVIESIAAQEETMMAFTAMLSELYGAFHRKVGADEPPAKAAVEAVVIEDRRFRSIDGRFDALSHTMDQRFDALSQRFDVLNQPLDGLSRAMDKRVDALNHAMDERSDVLSRAMDQCFDAFGQAMGQRLDALSRMIDDRFATINQRFAAMDAELARLDTKTATESRRLHWGLETVGVMDAQLARLGTKTATEFRHLRWGLGIVIALVLALVTKVILAPAYVSLADLFEKS